MRLSLCVDDGSDGSGNPVVAQYVLITAYSSFSSLMMKHRRRWRHKRTKRIRQLPLLRSEWMMVIATIERGAVATR